MNPLAPRAKEIIDSHILWSVGAGLVPIPVLDIAAVAAIQLDMLKQLATLHRIRYSESEGKAWLTALGGGIAAKLAANAVKLVPGFGSVVGGLSMAVLSGASTYALGRVADHQFATSGSMDLGNLDALKRAYQSEFERGKQVAEQYVQKREHSKDAFDKLERAKALRDKGVISDDDFNAIKAKLLGEV